MFSGKINEVETRLMIDLTRREGYGFCVALHDAETGKWWYIRSTRNGYTYTRSSLYAKVFSQKTARRHASCHAGRVPVRDHDDFPVVNVARPCYD